MTPSDKERLVLLFHMQVRSVPNAAHVKSMRFIIDALEDIHKNDEAFLYFNRKGSEVKREDFATDEEFEINVSRFLFIGKIESHGPKTTILFKAGDAEGTVPAFIKLDGTTRLADADDDDSNAYGAHLIIGPEATKGDNIGACRCVLERMPHLGRSTIIDFLNRLLKRRFENTNTLTFVDEKTKKRKTFYPKLQSFTKLSQSLKEDLAGGELKHVEFITKNVHIQADEELQATVESQRIKVKPTTKLFSSETAMNFINRLKNWGAANEYEEMQLFFHRRETNQSLSPRFQTDLDDAADATYARLEQIKGFSASLPQCPDTFLCEVQGKMVSLLEDDTYWT